MCRELTKRFEEVAVGTAAELAERFAAPVKGEVTLVLGPARARDDRELGAGRRRGARRRRRAASRCCDVVARLTDTSRNDLYRTTL